MCAGPLSDSSITKWAMHVPCRSNACGIMLAAELSQDLPSARNSRKAHRPKRQKYAAAGGLGKSGSSSAAKPSKKARTAASLERTPTLVIKFASCRMVMARGQPSSFSSANASACSASPARSSWWSLVNSTPMFFFAGCAGSTSPSNRGLFSGGIKSPGRPPADAPLPVIAQDGPFGTTMPCWLPGIRKVTPAAWSRMTMSRVAAS
mmetsp:Transcript_115773/g.332604  ORF Transcript_115773/g.332604 Transcript_115773/m.332604 type:complete len:206 (-) Transcript_115773:181-798(-)